MNHRLKNVFVAVGSTIKIFFSAIGMYLVGSTLSGAPALELPPLTAGAVYLALAGGFLLFVFRFDSRGKVREAFTIRPIPYTMRRHVLLAGAAMILLAPCLATVNRRLFRDQVHPPDALNDLFGQPLGWIPFLCVSILMAPLVEELVDRGWLQRRLERWWGAPAAIGLTSLFFGLSHLVLWMAPYFAIVGLILGYAAYATRSVWSSMFLHMSFNVSLTTFGGLGGDDLFVRWVDATGADGWIAPLGVIAIGGFLYYLDRSRRGLVDPLPTFLRRTTAVRI